MSYLIINIYLASDMTKSARDLQRVAHFSRRGSLKDVNRITVRKIIEKQGWTMPYHFGVSTKEWDHIALVYLSPNKEGHGRAGSSLHRWACKKEPTDG